MSSNRVLHQASYAVALVVTVIAGCNNIVGLDKISVSEEPSTPAGGTSGHNDSAGGGNTMKNGGDAGMNTASGGTGNNAGGGGDAASLAGEGGMDMSPPDCTTNQECTDRAEAEDMGVAGAAAETAAAAAVCVTTPTAHCVRLLSDDCDTITGNYLDNTAIVIGSLFSTKGTTAPTNIPRQQSAELAIEQINAAGGIPSNSTSANGRPLVMVSCDESTDLVRAATHLVSDLHVPAIVGPNTSQDTLDVSTKVTVPGGTVVMSPTGVASSIASLSDNDLTWLMVPSDVQRAPLMISQIGVLEQSLKVARNKTVMTLGVLYRNDALGIGTRTSLNDLVFNAVSLASPVNLNNNVQIDPYNGADATQATLVAKYVAFKPDIIVLAGTAEAITKLMQPIEAAWPAATARPNYVLIDSTKVPELLTAVTNNDDLRHRVRGTGITSGPTGKNTPGETFNGFVLDYNVRYGAAATISGMGPAHDAAYAIGLALAATRGQEISGASVAQGLRKLAGGATIIEASGTNVLAAFQKLSGGEKITAVGTFGMLDWDVNGAVQGGTLEMWCVGGPMTKPVYASSGLMFDIKSQIPSGAYVQCTP
ncbi:MAG: ABC transporter substrate-binding protein [Polyangiaceae bacterium]